MMCHHRSADGAAALSCTSRSYITGTNLTCPSAAFCMMHWHAPLSPLLPTRGLRLVPFRGWQAAATCERLLQELSVANRAIFFRSPALRDKVVPSAGRLTTQTLIAAVAVFSYMHHVYLASTRKIEFCTWPTGAHPAADTSDRAASGTPRRRALATGHGGPTVTHNRALRSSSAGLRSTLTPAAS